MDTELTQEVTEMTEDGPKKKIEIIRRGGPRYCYRTFRYDIKDKTNSILQDRLGGCANFVSLSNFGCTNFGFNQVKHCRWKIFIEACMIAPTSCSIMALGKYQ